MTWADPDSCGIMAYISDAQYAVQNPSRGLSDIGLEYEISHGEEEKHSLRLKHCFMFRSVSIAVDTLNFYHTSSCSIFSPITFGPYSRFSPLLSPSKGRTNERVIVKPYRPDFHKSFH